MSEALRRRDEVDKQQARIAQACEGQYIGNVEGWSSHWDREPKNLWGKDATLENAWGRIEQLSSDYLRKILAFERYQRRTIDFLVLRVRLCGLRLLDS